MSDKEEDVCPNCDSINIDFSALEVVDTCVYYPCQCNNCGTSFQQWYTLQFDEITNIEIPDNTEIKDNE
jgi:hypothetical protein